MNETNKLMKGVSITLKGTNLSTVSNQKGNFKLRLSFDVIAKDRTAIQSVFGFSDYKFQETEIKITSLEMNSFNSYNGYYYISKTIA